MQLELSNNIIFFSPFNLFKLLTEGLTFKFMHPNKFLNFRKTFSLFVMSYINKYSYNTLYENIDKFY